MKKLLVVISAVMLLSSCSVSSEEKAAESSPQSTSAASSEKEQQAVFSVKEQEQISINLFRSSDNNSVNLKCEFPSKVCYVPETDTLFYSDDSGIYQKNGGNAEQSSISRHSQSGLLTAHEEVLTYSGKGTE